MLYLPTVLLNEKSDSKSFFSGNTELVLLINCTLTCDKVIHIKKKEKKLKF